MLKWMMKHVAKSGETCKFLKTIYKTTHITELHTHVSMTNPLHPLQRVMEFVDQRFMFLEYIIPNQVKDLLCS